jgi:hypothetical protein
MKALPNSIVLNPKFKSCNIKVTDKTWFEKASTPELIERVNKFKLRSTF